MPSLTPRQLLRAQIQQSPPSDLDKKLLEKWLHAFEQGWTESAMAEWAAELPREGEFRRQALQGMVKTDLRQSWKVGRKKSLEAYLTEYPEVGTPETVSLDLIQAEIEARRQVGDPIAMAEVAGRFPRQLADLARGVARLWQDSPDATRPPATPPPPAPPPSRVPVVRRPEPEVNPSLSTPGPTMVTRTSGGHLALPSDPLRMDQIERYRLMEVLGRGAMGTVYLAEDTKLGRRVALKVPHFRAGESDELLTRFYTEARAAATLNHPNICPVFDVGENDGVPYLTMAFIKGQQLSDLIKGGVHMSPRQAAEIVRKLALAMQEAHSHDIIHRDLKPSNIMMNERGEPVVMDFGLARRLDQDARRTHEGSVLGTPAYMSPEQVRGAQKLIGPSCDIYSLGVILYELLTGQVPFPGNNMYDVLARILTETPPAPRVLRPEVDEELEWICLRAMEKEVDARFQSMADFAAALGDYLVATEPAAPARPGSSPEAGLAGQPARPASTPEPRVPPRRKVDSRELALKRALEGVLPAEPIGELPDEPPPLPEPEVPAEPEWKKHRRGGGPVANPFAGVGKFLGRHWRVLTVAVIFLAAGLTVSLIFRGTPETREALLADVQDLIRAENFEGALQRVRASAQPEEVREEARGPIRIAALQWLARGPEGGPAPERRLAVARALAQAFPGDSQVEGRVREAEALLAREQAQQLAAAGDYPAALDRLSGPAVASAPWAPEARAEVMRAWVASARGHLDGGRFAQAEQVAVAILQHDTGSVAAVEIREAAAAREASRLLGKGDFAAAWAKAGTAAAAEGKRLHAEILRKWYDAAEASKRARQWRAARDTLAALLKCCPSESITVAKLTHDYTAEQIEVALRSKDRASLEEAKRFLTGKGAEVLGARPRGELEARAQAAFQELDRPTAATASLGERLAAIETALPGLPPGPALEKVLAELGKLKEEIDEGGSRPLARQWATVDVLARHRDPKYHAELADRVQTLLGGDELPHEPARLCEVLRDLAGADPGRLRAASKTVAAVLGSDRLYSRDRERITPVHADLLTRRIKAVLLAEVPDWAGLGALLLECDQARLGSSEWAVTARAEWLLEQHGGKLVGTALRDARKVHDLSVKAAPGRYLIYVRARVMLAEGLTAAAAAEMFEAYHGPARAGDDELLAMLRTPYRRARAVASWQQAARTHRESDPFGEPYRRDRAADVYKHLKLAHEELKRAGEGLTDDLALHLALAAAQHKDRATVAEAASARPKLETRLPDRDAIALLLARAGADGGAGRLALYADAEARATSYENAGGAGEERFATLAARALRAVIEPGIQAGQDLKADSPLRESLARLYAGRARRFADYRRELPEPGQERTADEETVRSYTRAIELSPTPRSEYHVGRVMARLFLLLSPLDRDALKKAWPELEADVKRASEIDDAGKKRSFRTLQIRAMLLHADAAYLEDDAQAKLKNYLAADAEYAQAVAAAAGEGRELANILTNRARLLLEIGNFNSSRAKAHFDLALNQVNKAIDVSPHLSEAGDAHAIKGRILEDLGWKAGEKDQYDAALQAYRKAIEIAETFGLNGVGHYRMDLGRASFRAHEYGRLGEKYLTAAVEALTQALKDKLSERHASEARYWLGRSEWAARDYQAAEDVFTAVKAAPWRDRARQALPQLCLDAAQARSERGARKEAEAYMNRALAYAAALENTEPAYLHLTQGKVRELKQQHEDARTEYAKGLYAARQDLEVTVLLWASNLYLCLEGRWKDGMRLHALKTDAAYYLDKLAPHVANSEWTLAGRTRALFHGAAGLAHAHRGEDKQAIESFKAAVALSAPRDPDGWRWRFHLAKQMKDQLGTHPEYRAQALELAREALQSGPETEEIRPVRDLVKSLSK